MNKIYTFLKSYFFVFVFALLSLNSFNVFGQSPVTLTTGSSWTVPANVYSIKVECWGGGGAGGSAIGTASFRAAAGGGAGGAYAKVNTIFVAPGGSINYSIGAFGTASNTNGVVGNGGDTWFSSNTTVLAKGGAGAASLVCSSADLTSAGGIGTTTGSIGDQLYKGGNGATGTTPSGAGYSGGGGSSAGTGSDGNNSSSSVAGVAPTGGGIGGTGRSTNGGNGSAPVSGNGGGGGGAWAAASVTQRTGGSGAVGKIVITYFTSKYGVIYNPNSSTSGTVPLDNNTYSGGATVTVLTNSGSLAKTGYTFSGWNTATDGSGTNYAVSSSLTMPAANVTLYAKWIPVGFTVTYNDNGSTSGSVPVDGTAYSSGASVNTLSNSGTLAKTNYTFAGWNTAADGSGTTYTAPQTGAFTIATNTTLYAKWTPNNYTVTFDGNSQTSGSASPTSVSGNYNTNVTLATVGTLIKTSFTFSGWNTQTDGLGTDYAAGLTTYNITANITLYAKWIAAGTYTVTYNGNTNTGGSAPTDGSSPYTSGSSVTVLSAGSLTKTGYTFAGWNTAADGSGTDRAVASTFSMPAANTILYAKWTVNTYTVTFNTNSGTGSPNISSVSGNYNTNVTLATAGTLSKTGYTFAGWNTAVDGSGTTYAAGLTTYNVTADVTLYAQWTYNVSYNGNGNTSGTAPTDATNYTQAASVNTASNSGTLAKTGYTFAGWNTAVDGSGTTYTAPQTGAFSNTGNITLYAKWTPNNNTITFNGNGNTGGSMSNQTIATAASANLTTNAFTKTGYTFAGWNTLANGTGTSYTNGQSYTMGTANVTLYAQWTPNNNTITFNGNGSTGGSMSNQTIATAASANLTTNAFTRTGYTFAGWATSAGGAVAYADGASYTMGTANVTLYAKWSPNNYTITFDGNGNTGGSMSNQTIASGASANLTTNAYTKTSYTFAGWNTLANGTGTSYTDGQSYTMGTANVTLYAQWTPGPVEKNYVLITSTSDLEAGKKYIIASAASGTASLLGYQNTNNRPVATLSPYTIASGNITATPAGTLGVTTSPYELTLGGSSGAWTLTDGATGINLQATSSSSNFLKSGSGTWTISFTSNAAVITSTNGGTNNIIRYNSISSLFSCYSTGQLPVYLYKETTSTCTAAPTISTQPNNITVATGATANFSVGGSGGGLTYQWQVSTDCGATWNNVSDGTGGTSLSYTTIATTLAMSGYQYRVVITSLCGTITSNAINLVVNDVTQALYTEFTSATYGWTDQAYATASWTESINSATWKGGNVNISTSSSRLQITSTNSAGWFQTPVVSNPISVTINAQNSSSSVNTTHTLKLQYSTDGTTFNDIISGGLLVTIGGDNTTYNDYTYDVSSLSALSTVYFKFLNPTGTNNIYIKSVGIIKTVPPTSATDYTWTGQGNTTLWTTPCNWSPKGIPTAIDNVTFNTSPTWLLNIVDSRTVNNFTLNGTGNFNMASTGKLSINGTVSYGGTATATLDCDSWIYETSSSSQPVPPLNYGNLDVLGGTRVFPNGGTIGICKAFNVDPTLYTYTVTGSTVNYFSSLSGWVMTPFTYYNLKFSGTGDFSIGYSSPEVNKTINVLNDFTQTAGTVYLGETATKTATLNVDGNATISGGTFEMNNVTGGTGIFNLKGDLSVGSAAILKSTNTSSNFNFTGTYSSSTPATIQTIDNASIPASSVSSQNTKINFNVKQGAYAQLINQNFKLGNSSVLTVETGAIFDFGFDGANGAGTNALNVTGNGITGTGFTSQSQAYLKISSPLGIVNTSGSVGNIQTNTAPVINTLETFHYTGKANQHTGIAIGATSNGRAIIVDLNTNSLTLTPDVTFGITSAFNTYINSGNGGILDIRKGQFSETATEYITGSDGSLSMGNGTLYKIVKGYSAPLATGAEPATPNNFIPRLTGTFTLVGGTVELGGSTAGNYFQSLRGGKTYYSIKFSGSNTYSYPTDASYTYKNLTSNIAINDSLYISETAVLDCIDRSGGAVSFTGNGGLVMDGGRIRFKNSSTPQPELNGINTAYNLIGGTVEFYGTSAIQQQRIRGNYGSPTKLIPYYNMEINAAAANYGTTNGGNVDLNSSFILQGILNVNSPAVLRMDETDFIYKYTGNTTNNVNILNGASLLYGSPYGITTVGIGGIDDNTGVANAAAGNIRTSIRTFNSGASYGFVGNGNMNSGDGLPATIAGLYVYKTASADVVTLTTILGNQTTDNGVLGLHNGKILSSTNNKLILETSATIVNTPTNASGLANMGHENSYVIGLMGRNNPGTTPTDLIFPIGSSALYGPISVTPANGTPQTYNAEYISTGYGTYTLDPANSPQLDHVSKVEYWNVSSSITPSANDDAKIKLFWRTYSDVGPSSSEWSQLRVAHFDGADWNTEGNSPSFHLSPSTAWGWLQSDNFLQNFSPITIGTLTSFNPLPVELTSFTGTCVEDGISRITWSTASEMNSKEFLVQRSEDGLHYTTVAVIPTSGFSNQPRNYSITDTSLNANSSYYRLIETDRNGKQTFYSFIQVRCNEVDDVHIFYIQPKVVVEVNSTKDKQVGFNVYDVSGKLLSQENKQIVRGYNRIDLNIQHKLADGVYIIQMIDGDKVNSTKVMVH